MVTYLLPFRCVVEHLSSCWIVASYRGNLDSFPPLETENWPPIVEIHLILIPVKPGSSMLSCPMLAVGTLASLQTAERQTHLCVAKTSPQIPQSMLRWWLQAQTPLSLHSLLPHPCAFSAWCSGPFPTLGWPELEMSGPNLLQGLSSFVLSGVGG